MNKTLTFAIVALALAALTGASARHLAPSAAKPFDVAYVPRSGPMRWASLGHRTLVANLNWLRLVQYVGEPRADARGWEKLRPLAELVTDLDPGHGYAYQVAGNFLGSAGLVSDSSAILEKGSRNVPDRYILPFHRAVNAFLYEGDYALAGRWFERAAQTPGAPPHLRDYVVAMYVKGDASDAAISFLEHLRTRAEDEETQRSVEKQLMQAYLERDAEAIEHAAEAYRAAAGIRPIVIAQLVYGGLLAGVPPDPFGGEYYLDADGRVRSTAHQRRFERPKSGAARQQVITEAQLRLKTMEQAPR